MSSTAPWASQQIAEFLAAVSSFPDEDAAVTGGLERATEALEAEIGFMLRGGAIKASLGFPRGKVPDHLLTSIMRGPPVILEVQGFGLCHVAVADLEKGRDERLILIRSGTAFDTVETSLLRSMARVLEITLKTMRTLAQERFLHGQLREREKLLEKLARIQRSISHRAPLQEVLDAITLGARELLNDEVVGLRLIDADDPTRAILVSSNGVSADILEKAVNTPLQVGAGGQAILEQRLIVIEDYASSDRAIEAFAQDRLQTAMAAPVYEDGRITGSLAVASYRPERRYSDSEKEMLVALAEHASLALTDAKIVDAMREAQRTKDMFLAMVSHELKTPLTVIMGVLLTLKANMERLPVAVRDDLMESAYTRARDLERLIEMLLRGARAELAGAQEMVRLPVALHQSVAGFSASRPIRMDVVPDLSIFIDPAALRQILGVLLENAISHSPADSVIGLTASLDKEKLIIDVSNDGSLPMEMKPDELFRPFQRGADATSSGVGLGLYVAAKLAESMDGSITAYSTGGRVTFSFSCDLGVPTSAQVMA